MAGPPSQDRPSASSHNANVLLKFGAIGLVMAGMAGGFAWSAGWLSPHRLTQSRMIAALQGVDGVHPGFRRNHAKGVCVTGWFDGSGDATSLSSASVFRRERSVVVGRFALAGGNPFQTDAPGKVRSLALSLRTPDGAEWRMGINDIPVFVVRNAEEFYQQLLASRPEPETGKPNPTRLKAFMASHPATAQAVAQIMARKVSSGFANDTFLSLNAFRFINADGVSTPVRWAMVPEQDFAPAGPGGSADYLFDDLAASLQDHPLRWKLMITIGEPGDSTSDSTIAWPASRKQVEAGVLTLDAVKSEQDGPCTGIVYDPLVLPPGIAASDDPILSARSAAYARSFTLRSGEAKPASAVTPAEIASAKPGEKS